MTIENQIKRLERKIKMCSGMMESTAKSIVHYSELADVCLKRKGSQDGRSLFHHIAGIEDAARSYRETQYRIDNYRDEIYELRRQLEAA
jgi:hypothetical protein